MLCSIRCASQMNCVQTGWNGTATMGRKYLLPHEVDQKVRNRGRCTQHDCSWPRSVPYSLDAQVKGMLNALHHIFEMRGRGLESLLCLQLLERFLQNRCWNQTPGFHYPTLHSWWYTRWRSPGQLGKVSQLTVSWFHLQNGPKFECHARVDCSTNKWPAWERNRHYRPEEEQ